MAWSASNTRSRGMCLLKALEADHAGTCKFGGDVVARHNTLCNFILNFCKQALLNPKLEAGAGLGQEMRLTRPADILIPSWSTGDKPAATGDKPAATGDKPAATGDKPAATGDKAAATGDKPAATGDKPAATGDKPAATSDKPAAIALLCLNQAFCPKWVWLQVQQRGTHVII